MSLHMVFLVVALLCFLIGAAPAASSRVNLVSLGLAFLVLSMLVS